MVTSSKIHNVYCCSGSTDSSSNISIAFLTHLVIVHV
jgi:hypothetical protein